MALRDVGDRERVGHGETGTDGWNKDKVVDHVEWSMSPYNLPFP